MRQKSQEGHPSKDMQPHQGRAQKGNGVVLCRATSSSPRPPLSCSFCTGTFLPLGSLPRRERGCGGVRPRGPALGDRGHPSAGHPALARRLCGARGLALHTATKTTLLGDSQHDRQRPRTLVVTEEPLERMWLECDPLTGLDRNNNFVILYNLLATK